MTKTRNFIILAAMPLLLLFLTACPEESGQNVDGQVQESNKMLLVEYNVENLFDIKDDEGKVDEEFMPGTKKDWTQERYEKKLKDLAEVITRTADRRPPELLALIEVENRKVLEDLIALDNMNAYYKIVHEESPDFRGIDVALIYNTEKFKELSHEAIKVTMPDNERFVTRDILYVKLLVKKSDTLHVFVNHWSSRRGGEAKSEPKRVRSASLLRAKVDSIQKMNAEAKILITGDMNDEPNNNSILKTLKATGNKENVADGELYNLMFDRDQKDEGTYFYKDSWNMLDHIIVSHSMLGDVSGISCDYNSAGIYKEDWILFDHPKANAKVPSRTYGGPNYYGGYSDHLPIFVELTFN